MFFSVHVKVKMLAPNRRVHGRAWQAIRAYCFFPYTLTFWATIQAYVVYQATNKVNISQFIFLAQMGRTVHRLQCTCDVCYGNNSLSSFSCIIAFVKTVSPSLLLHRVNNIVTPTSNLSDNKQVGYATRRRHADVHRQGLLTNLQFSTRRFAVRISNTTQTSVLFYKQIFKKNSPVSKGRCRRVTFQGRFPRHNTHYNKNYTV